MRAPKPLKREKSTSGDDHCVYNPSIYLPTLVHTASSKACLTSQRPAQPHLQTLSDNKDSLEQKFLNSSELPEEEVREEAQCPRVGPNIYVAVAAAQFKLHFSHPSKKEEIRYIVHSYQRLSTECLLHCVQLCQEAANAQVPNKNKVHLLHSLLSVQYESEGS